MKSFLIIASIILCALTLSLTPSPVRVQENVPKDTAPIRSEYAQITEETDLMQVVDGQWVSITSLPPTYFVEILGEPIDSHYPIGYFDLHGYVRGALINKVDYEPVTKFAQGGININDEISGGVNLRRTPYNTSPDNIAVVIPHDTTDILYYGTRRGSTVRPQSNTWYYVRARVDGQLYWGYVYSGIMTSQSIVDNVVERVPPPITPGPDTTSTAASMSSTTLYILIGVLSVPALLIMWLIFKKPAKGSSDD
jgi:hypothetical protein